MTSFQRLSSIQKEVIESVSSLPSNASKNLVLESLNVSLENEYENDVEELDIMTPLMIACEKGQVEVIRYILSKRINKQLEKDNLTIVFGHPMQACKMYGGNTAMHFMAVSNYCSETLDAFQQLVESYDKDFFLLLKQPNMNNDIPIMMAAVKGNIDFLRHVLYQIPKEEDINALLQMKNNQNETVLKLAFGHGQYDILKLLIRGESNNNYKLTVTNKDASECQRIYNHIENTIQSMNKGTSKLWDKKMLDTKKCLILINVAAEEHCREMENELLLEETNKKIPKKKIKKKKKKNHNTISKKTNEKETNNFNNLRFITLEDGSIVSSSNSNPHPDIQTNVNIIEKQEESESLETMLRDRFRTTNDNNQISSMENDTIEQTMNSLCLDVSMLLLTPHGMAMKLSPCQLDAVERLLKDQVDAVMEAKKIQDRLLHRKI